MSDFIPIVCVVAVGLGLLAILLFARKSGRGQYHPGTEQVTALLGRLRARFSQIDGQFKGGVCQLAASGGLAERRRLMDRAKTDAVQEFIALGPTEISPMLDAIEKIQADKDAPWGNWPADVMWKALESLITRDTPTDLIARYWKAGPGVLQDSALAKANLPPTAEPPLQNTPTPPIQEPDIFLACERGLVDRVKHLLASGTPIDTTDNNGGTPLFKATRHGRIDAVRALLDAGATVGRPNNFGFTPLHMACAHGHLDTATLLIERGASVNASDKTGFTPLHAAADNGHLQIAHLLVEKGANVNARTDKDATPFGYANHRSRTEVANYLKEKGGVE